MLEETRLCEKYFHRQTIEKLRLACIQTLIVSHLDAISEGLVISFTCLAVQVSSILQTEDSAQKNATISLLSPLRSVYTLFREIHSISSLTQMGQHLLICLSNEFSHFGMKLGESLRSIYSKTMQHSPAQRVTKEVSVTYVKRLMELLLLLGEVCLTIFEDHTYFVQALKKVSHNVVNSEMEGFNIIEFYTAYCQHCFAVCYVPVLCNFFRVMQLLINWSSLSRLFFVLLRTRIYFWIHTKDCLQRESSMVIFLWILKD